MNYIGVWQTAHMLRLHSTFVINMQQNYFYCAKAFHGRSTYIKGNNVKESFKPCNKDTKKDDQ